MKAVYAAILALAATALARPSSRPQKRQYSDAITFTVTNDQSPNDNQDTVTISVDNTNFSFQDLFGQSDLVQNGAILASSANLVANPYNLDFECDFVNNGVTIAKLTQDDTFANFDGQGNPLQPVDVTNAFVVCQY